MPGAFPGEDEGETPIHFVVQHDEVNAAGVEEEERAPLPIPPIVRREYSLSLSTCLWSFFFRRLSLVAWLRSCVFHRLPSLTRLPSLSSPRLNPFPRAFSPFIITCLASPRFGRLSSLTCLPSQAKFLSCLRSSLERFLCGGEEDGFWLFVHPLGWLLALVSSKCTSSMGCDRASSAILPCLIF